MKDRAFFSLSLMWNFMNSQAVTCASSITRNRDKFELDPIGKRPFLIAAHSIVHISPRMILVSAEWRASRTSEKMLSPGQIRPSNV
jgi:hypothetical protein